MDRIEQPRCIFAEDRLFPQFKHWTQDLGPSKLVVDVAGTVTVDARSC